MSYPTPMDVAEAEDREAGLSPSERLANICAALEEDLSESPFTREEWERMDAERLELLAANDALAAELAATRHLLKETVLDREAHRASWQRLSRPPIRSGSGSNTAGQMNTGAAYAEPLIRGRHDEGVAALLPEMQMHDGHVDSGAAVLRPVPYQDEATHR